MSIANNGQNVIQAVMTVNETFLSFNFNVCRYCNDLLEKLTSTFFISTDYPEFLREISEDNL